MKKRIICAVVCAWAASACVSTASQPPNAVPDSGAPPAADAAQLPGPDAGQLPGPDAGPIAGRDAGSVPPDASTFQPTGTGLQYNGSVSFERVLP